MKKKDYLKLKSEAALNKIRFRKALRRKGKNYTFGRIALNRSVLGGSPIMAPVILSIYNTEGDKNSIFSKTVEFIELLESNIGKKECVVDFSNTRSASAPALLSIYAAIENANQNGDCKSRIAWSQESPAVNKLLKRLNFNLLIQNKLITYDFTKMNDLPIISSVGSQHMDEIIDFIQSKFYQNEMSPEVEYAYGDAVSETINNVRLHAYPDLEQDQKKWWLICDVYGDELYLAIYDLGIGIPKTVLEKQWFLASLESVYPSEYKELLESSPGFKSGWVKAYVPQRIKDSQLIYLSMQGDVTGTKKSKHGQGSKSIKALVNDTDDGKLWVFSNNGLCTFDEENEGEEDDFGYAIFKLPKKLPGTLVQWNIKLI
jgi:hypothetical protein